MQTEAFTIKQASFEGPVEVLLELIEKRKLFVSDISLAEVTDDFMRFMSEGGMQPDMVASFLSVAATLILIKARSLLPTLELTEDEKESIDELERRVALYSLVVEISNQLAREYGKKVSFEGVSRSFGPVFAPDTSIDVNDLSALLAGAITRVPPPVAEKKPEAKVYRTISIREVLSTLQERLEHAIEKMSFNDIRVMSPDADDKSKKVYTIVSFLGMLELVRRGFIDATQDHLFEDITLEKQMSSAPVVVENGLEDIV